MPTSRRSKIENLRAFAKLYGYVKYFHPSDEAAALDWERFAVMGASRMLRTAGRERLKRELERLFLPIAPTIQLFVGRPRRPVMLERPPAGSKRGPVVAWQHLGVSSFDMSPQFFRSVRVNRVNRIKDEFGRTRLFSKPVFKKVPTFGEATVKPLGVGLWCRVPLTLRSIGSQTWGPPSPWPLDQLQGSLKRFTLHTFRATRADVRVAGVIMAWNAVQHFFPYFDVVRVDWPGALRGVLARAMRDRTVEDFAATLHLLMELVRDGHARIVPPASKSKTWARPRLAFEWVQGRIVIAWAPKNSPAKCGDIVLRIDGELALHRLKRAERMISGSPQWKRFKAIAGWADVELEAWGTRGSRMRLQLKRGGRVLKVYVSRTSNQTTPEPRKHKAVEEVAQDVWYVDLTRAKWKRIKRALPVLSRAHGVVFDLRGYPSEWNVTWNIVRYLLRVKRTSQTWIKYPRRIYPDRERIVGYWEGGWRIRLGRPRLRGRIVLLTNAGAASQPECIVGYFERHRLGTIIGEPTAGANGEPAGIRLPGGFDVHWTGARVVKHDGSRFHGIGFQPDIPASRTLRGIREGRDEFVERALIEIEKGRPGRD